MGAGKRDLRRFLYYIVDPWQVVASAIATKADLPDVSLDGLSLLSQTKESLFKPILSDIDIDIAFTLDEFIWWVI